MSAQRDFLVSIASQVLAQCDFQTLGEVEGLCFWRRRALREEQTRAYSPGDDVQYLLRDGKTLRDGTVSHVNKFSLSIWRGAGRTEAIPIERIVGKLPTQPERPSGFDPRHAAPYSWPCADCQDNGGACAHCGGYIGHCNCHTKESKL